MTSTLQRIKDSIYSSEKQEILYSTALFEKRAWPTATWLSSALDESLIDLLRDMSGVDEIQPDNRLESDLGLDELDLLEFHIKFNKHFGKGHERVCPFETWGDMSFLLYKEGKVPFFDYSVAELLDMIVRSGAIKKPLSKKGKETLLHYDFSGQRRAETMGDKFPIRIFASQDEPGSFFITDPFVVNREQHESVDAVLKLFHNEERRKSDALFAEIVRSMGNYSVRYNSRTSILNSSLSYTKAVEEIQANYRLMRDGNGYYVLKTTNESVALKIAEEFRRTLIDELHFVDLC